ncbi:ribonuclease H-like domain-containing protein [Tanacetum coccineum]
MEKASKRQAEQDEWLKKFYQSTEANRETHDKIIQGLEAKVKTLANEVEERANNKKFEECKTIYSENGLPLYTPFYYSPEEIEYFSANSGFSNNEEQETDDSGMAEAVAALEATLKKKREEPKKVKQNVNYYVDPYEPLIPFPKRLEHHAEAAMVHQTMESLKKIKINRPLLKEIRQTDNYAKQMKYLVENKHRTEKDNEIRMNLRCFVLLQDHLPLKEQDPRSFILPCSIGKLDFKNALADLGASISIMPFSMYKHLGIGKLEPINMLIEMADNTKCTPKVIVENLLIKIDKFIFLVDFVILDIVEDIRMPIILGRPLIATAHAQVDIFRKTVSLEVGSEKVIFKMRSSFTATNFESVRSIKSETFVEDGNLKEIDYDLFLYDSKSCEFNRLLCIDQDIFSYEIDVQKSYEEIVYKITNVENEKYSAPQEKREHWFRAILQEKENEHQYWASCNPSSNICDGGDLPINIEKHYWESNNDSKREELACEDKEDLEGLLDYLKPESYDRVVDLDNEAYIKRRCKLLGMTYKEPTPIRIEKAKVTRYTVFLGETYTKVKGKRDCSIDTLQEVNSYNYHSEKRATLRGNTDQDSAHIVAASKVPMLKPGEYEIWRIRIEQYIQMIDYALWEVIENGATLPKTTIVEGVVTEMPITTAEEKDQRRLEVKARSTLMMGIPNEHQLKFNSIKDAKKLLEAVKKRFDGNEATKKTQWNLLNQQYENFTAPSSEMLDQTFDRLQKLRNKANLDTMSMDDLYNNLKVYEPEVKGMFSSSSSTHNMAFVSSSNNNTSSTNGAVNTAHGVSTASTQVNAANSTNIDNLNDMEEMDLRWQMAMLTMRARRFLKKYQKECRALRNQDNKKKESSRRSVPVETSTSIALVSCHGLGGYDWSD